MKLRENEKFRLLHGIYIYVCVCVSVVEQSLCCIVRAAAAVSTFGPPLHAYEEVAYPNEFGSSVQTTAGTKSNTSRARASAAPKQRQLFLPRTNFCGGECFPSCRFPPV